MPRKLKPKPMLKGITASIIGLMPRYRLLAIDVDGTLVNSSDELTPATRAALAAR